MIATEPYVRLPEHIETELINEHRLTNYEQLDRHERVKICAAQKYALQIIKWATKNDPEKPIIFVWFTNTEPFRSCAVRTSTGEYVVLIPTSLLEALDSVYGRLLRHPSISRLAAGLPGISKSPQPRTESLLEARKRLTAPREQSSLVTPYDISAAVMGDLSFTFALLHEIGHIRNGHLRYQAFVESRGKKLNALDMQALEMDADAHAAGRHFRWCLDKKRFRGPFEFGDHSITMFSQPVQSIYNCLLSIYFQFITFETAQKPGKFNYDIDHPPMAVRLIWIFGALHKTMTRSTPTGRAQFDNAVDLLFQSCERAYADLTGLSPSIRSDQVLAATKSGFLTPILARWAQLYPHLMQHKHAANLVQPAA